MAIETKRPLGMRPTSTVASMTASSSGTSEQDVLDDEQQLQVQDDEERDADDALDLALQRRQRAPERAWRPR